MHVIAFLLVLFCTLDRQLVLLGRDIDFLRGKAGHSQGDLVAILGQSFGFVQLLRDPEPGLSSIRRLVIGAVAAPTDDEKQDKKDKKEKKPKKIKDWDPSLPPEVQFDYFVPDKVATGEVFPPPVYEHFEVPAPETRFEYIVPEKAVGDFGVPDYTPMDPNRPVPEKTFEYFLKEFTTVYPIEPPGKIPTTYPEVRFTYYTPPKG